MMDTTDVTLLRGVMQHWSDLALGSVADSALVRALVERRLDAVRSCVLVGAHSLELVTALAQRVERLTVVTRSIPDATTIADALRDVDGVEVLAGVLDDVVARGDRYDLVLALDDLDRIASLESDAPHWSDLFAQVLRVRAESGRVLVGVESELGLHRLATLRSRLTSNGDGDWAVLATFDASRPRTRRQLESVLVESALVDPAGPMARIMTLHGHWMRPTCYVRGTAPLTAAQSTVLTALMARTMNTADAAADPSRVLRVAHAAGLLDDFAAGWLVEVGEPVAGEHLGEGAGASGAVVEPTAVQPESTLVVSADSGELVAFVRDDSGVRRVRVAARAAAELLPVAPDAIPFAECLVDACAAHDLPLIRRLLADYVAWLREGTVDGEPLDAQRSVASLDTVLHSAGQWVALLPCDEPMVLEERVLRSLGEFVGLLRRRGARHPWPASTDDRTMLRTLAAMAGLGTVTDPDYYLEAPTATSEPSPLDTVAGLRSVVARLEERRAALESRAGWFERRLGEREHELRRLDSVHDQELRVEQARQETLRRHVADVKGSLSFRTGRAVLSPAFAARRLAQRLKDS